MYLHFLFLALLCCTNANGEVFSSAADIAALIDIELEVIKVLNEIKAAQEKRIAAIQKFTDKFGTLRAGRDVEELRNLATHPIMAFRFVNNLVTELSRLEELISPQSYAADFERLNFVKNTSKFPGKEDITGIADALVRLQDTYRITPEQFANGEIPNLPSVGALSASECYLIGHQQAEIGRNRSELPLFQSASHWLRIAEERFPKESEEDHLISFSEILDWQQFALFGYGGNLLKVLELIRRLDELDPEYPTVKENRKFYTELWNNLTAEEKEKITTEASKNDGSYVFPDEKFHTLCRGEGKLNHEVLRIQKCYLEDYGDPVLRLQPVKTELIHLKPDIYVLHDVATHQQLDEIIKIGMERVQRARVVSARLDDGDVSPTRVSKNAFLEFWHPVLDKVNTYSCHVAHLNCTVSESLQINNYGIGGLYLPHYDYFRDPTGSAAHHVQDKGDRIATLMYYMSDVDAGGATVFPNINVTLFPEKGAAAFWFNLYRDGNGDVNTLHAGCPVLSGTKWVTNKWFREIGQDGHRPCPLEPDSPPSARTDEKPQEQNSQELQVESSAKAALFE